MSNSNNHPEYSILKFHQNMGPFSIQEIADVIGAGIYRNSQKISALTENIEIHDVRTLKQATNRDISFFSKQKYSDDLTQTNAVACITLEKYVEKAPQGVYVLAVSNVQIAYAKVVSLFYKVATALEHNPQNAHIDPTAKLGTNCKVGYGSFIGKNAEIGNNAMIHPRVYIGDNVVIGDDCIIYDSCSIKHSIIGSGTIIHSGARIGQDGFGYSTENGRHLKIPQVGRVVIGNEVEIGANTTIDRGSLDDTVIGDMCKIDNLVQIGHNVRLGHGCIIVSQVGISGSTKLGNYVVLGGQVGIADNLSLGDCVQVGAKSGVMRDASSGSILMGYPAQNARDFFKQLAYLKKFSKI